MANLSRTHARLSSTPRNLPVHPYPALVHLIDARNIPTQLQKESFPKSNLPQLYRFCFVMLGDSGKAQEIFQSIMHEAALRAAQGELPRDRLWLFREARGRCLETSEAGIQAEETQMEEHDIHASAPTQIKQLEPEQLAIWIAGAPEPQRTALALFYLDQFNHEELLDLTELKTAELAKVMANARQQFQAWLNATRPQEEA
jgi:DNA-directed RNA polymerase specialized sigma24 family protein